MLEPHDRRHVVGLLASLVAITSLVVTGPALAQDLTGPAAPLFATIDRDADVGYFREQQAAFVDGIEGLGGIATVADAGHDPLLAIALVERAIAAGAKGIAITVPDQTIGPLVARAAADAGVALVAANDPIVDEDGVAVPFVGHGDAALGARAGAAAARLAIDSGWLSDTSGSVAVLSAEVPSSAACRDRTGAARGALLDAGVSGEAILAVDSTGRRGSALAAAAPVIAAHPAVTGWVVIGCADEGIDGVLAALAAAGVSAGDVIAVGIGADEACRAWATGQPSGFRAAVLVSGRDVGRSAAQVLWDGVASGVALTGATVVEPTVVDPQTYESAMDPSALADCAAQPIASRGPS